MILKAKKKWWSQLLRETDGNSVIRDAICHANDDRFVEVESDVLSKEELDTLRDIATGYSTPTARNLVWKIDTIVNLYAEPKGIVVEKLEALVDAIRAYVGPMPRRWVYVERKDDEQVLPYFIENVVYHKKQIIVHKEQGGGSWREVKPAYVTMGASALRRGSGVSITWTWHVENLRGGITIPELFKNSKISLETPWMAKAFDEQIAKFEDTIGRLGQQFQAVGYGTFTTKDSNWYNSYSDKIISMVREGYPTKVIIDDNDEDESDERSSRRTTKSRDDSVSNKFWMNYDIQRLGGKVSNGEEETTDDEDLDDDEDTGDSGPTQEQLEQLAKTSVPMHPYVRVFDLDKHEFLTIHINYIEDYPWDPTLIDKLVLPTQTKDMIQILVSGTNDSKEDIIRGKMQGVIVIATGEPGTGKTLTAEVFSETIQRPLYVVQCAQLGTTASDIEQRLKAILKRAQRWQAILLIDEADVYIRARGDDIEQNAIVGVFLRVLEYYRGVLFMTSNRATVIDDAIMSRASSWIRYAMPDTQELVMLWKVLSKQYEIELNDKDIGSLIEHLPKLSGRCVRNLLKLARHLSQARKEPVTEAMLRSVAQFQYLPHMSDVELRNAAN